MFWCYKVIVVLVPIRECPSGAIFPVATQGIFFKGKLRFYNNNNNNMNILTSQQKKKKKKKNANTLSLKISFCEFSYFKVIV